VRRPEYKSGRPAGLSLFVRLAAMQQVVGWRLRAVSTWFGGGGVTFGLRRLRRLN